MKARKPLSFRVSLWEVLFVSTIMVLMLCLYFLVVPFFELVELKAYDLHFQQRGRIEPSGLVTFVTIDEESVKREGRWPWPRRRMAQLIEAVASQGPRGIGLDMGFFESDLKLRQEAILDLQGRLRKDIVVAPPELLARLQAIAEEEDDDEILAKTLQNLPTPLVLGHFFFFREDDYTPELAPPDVVEDASFRLVQITREPRKGALNEAVGIAANIPLIRKACQFWGSFNLFSDPDGTVRWMPLVIRYGKELFPSVALQTLSAVLPELPLMVKADEWGIRDIRLGPVSIPTNNKGELLLNYYGPAYTFPHSSASALLHREVPSDHLRDKLVIIGNTTIGLHDMRPTPFSPVSPGVELHCTVMENILQQHFLVHSERSAPYHDMAALLLVAVLFLVLQSFVHGVVALGGGVLVLLGGYIVATHYFFLSHGLWLNHVYPSLTLIIAFVGTSVHRHRKQEREKRMIRQTFGLYVHDSVVEEMLASPDKLKLGGVKQELTVLFSDIRGFTSLSEQLPPEELVPQLNEYLTSMTQVVLDHHGTLDKYIGDAIMAIFGAPLPYPDHSLRACATALKMVETLRPLNQEWAARGRPILQIGIGINTGLMMVGNMGSERRFDYTVIGDNVNLASRLEGLTKDYGVSIVVSETTWAAAKDEFVGRELDQVRVKGKRRLASVYQLMDTLENADSYREPLTLYRQAMDLFRGEKWLQAMETLDRVLVLWPGDPLSLHYRKRCAELLTQSPGDECHSVEVLDEK